VIGEQIRKARKRAGLSQEELAFRAKCTRNYISLVELNVHSPTLDLLIRICHALGVKASTLVDKVEGSVGAKQSAK
jgi:transcriptional regulator with XRE-family HTH domain